MKTTILTGVEGPKTDPYGFTEYIVYLDDVKFTLHLGLDSFIKRDDDRILGIGDFHLSSSVSLTDIFEKFLNVNIEQIRKDYDVDFSKCKKCGSEEIRMVNGFPGETIFICDKCECFINSVFNKSAIE